METIYVKADMNVAVTNRTVYLRDVIRVYGYNKSLVQELNEQVLLEVPNEKKCKYTVSILKIIEVIQKNHPELFILNEGENDFIIEYIPPNNKKEKKILEILKTIAVCLAVFFGSAFTIMTFNMDVDVDKIFLMIYQLVLGQTKPKTEVLEITYSIGIPIGIIVFFNHFFRFKIDSDPTPLQVQLRLYEQDVNTAIIENATREGKTLDA